MNEQENTKLVKRSYELFKSGDIETLLSLYSEDISWEVPEVENSKIGGKISGRENVANWFKSFDETEELLKFEQNEFISQGDKVVVLGHFKARIKSTNKEYTSDYVQISTVKDGKITGFLEFFDTAAAEKANTATQAA